LSHLSNENFPLTDENNEDDNRRAGKFRFNRSPALFPLQPGFSKRFPEVFHQKPLKINKISVQSLQLQARFA